ncbi:hypothetical protein HAX54_034319 [Datura stramonium]|uniref:Uncharacterized protein n=1 Tax=Datura stramonium TaxID=4076 RepID=A0ABS8VHK7_DATST|nr:hypothetical protein [Datura stramonium]
MEKQDDIIKRISSRREEENPRAHEMILQQSMPKIPILKKLENESFTIPNFTVDHPLGISPSTWNEQENYKTNNPLMSEISCLERDFMKPTDLPSFGIQRENSKINVMINKQESDFMKPKLFKYHPYGSSTSRRLGEQEDPKTNGLLFQQRMSNIPTLEKLENYLVKPKLKASQGNETFMQGVCPWKSYVNQAITLKSLNSGKRNEDGAYCQLQSSWVQSWNAQDTHFNITTNKPHDKLK